MEIFSTIIICFISVTCLAQTKLIAHKSHSGNNANFRLAMEKKLFDISQSNFGDGPIILTDKADTIVLKSSNTILIHRKRVKDTHGKISQNRFIQTFNKENYPHLFTTTNKETLKKLIKETYNVDADSAVFIGFGEKFNKNN